MVSKAFHHVGKLIKIRNRTQRLQQVSETDKIHQSLFLSKHIQAVKFSEGHAQMITASEKRIRTADLPGKSKHLQNSLEKQQIK